MVVTDYNMPEINGIELLSKIKPTGSLIVSTRGRPSGYKGDFLQKPLNLIEFKNQVIAICKRTTLIRE